LQSRETKKEEKTRYKRKGDHVGKKGGKEDGGSNRKDRVRTRKKKERFFVGRVRGGNLCPGRSRFLCDIGKKKKDLARKGGGPRLKKTGGGGEGA